jgi:hypothetical protein
MTLVTLYLKKYDAATGQHVNSEQFVLDNDKHKTLVVRSPCTIELVHSYGDTHPEVISLLRDSLSELEEDVYFYNDNLQYYECLYCRESAPIIEKIVHHPTCIIARLRKEMTRYVDS